jgi:hypothetical protein
VFRMDFTKVDRDIAYFFICFSNACCKCVYLDVAYVSHICCECFIMILRMFVMVSSVFRCFCECFKRMFQVFHLSSDYIASVASRCFKSSSVLHILQCDSPAAAAQPGHSVIPNRSVRYFGS